MRRRHRVAAQTVSLLALFALAYPTQFARAESAAADEVRASMQASDWTAAASRVDRALFPTPPDPAQRYELLMLKGECRLQLRDSIGAATAFKAAAKSAGRLEELAAAVANALVIERSSLGKFRRRDVTPGEEIDVLPPESRKRAMLALRDEIVRQYESQINAALAAKQLPPIEKIFPRVAEMYLLDVCASGRTDSASGAQARELGGRAYELMRDELRKSDSRIDQLSQIANSSSEGALGWRSGRMGLTSPQRDEVKRMIPYVVKIRDRAAEYRRVAARIGGDPGRWDTLIADAVGVVSDADALLSGP